MADAPWKVDEAGTRIPRIRPCRCVHEHVIADIEPGAERQLDWNARRVDRRHDRLDRQARERSGCTTHQRRHVDRLRAVGIGNPRVDQVHGDPLERDRRAATCEPSRDDHVGGVLGEQCIERRDAAVERDRQHGAHERLRSEPAVGDERNRLRRRVDVSAGKRLESGEEHRALCHRPSSVANTSSPVATSARMSPTRTRVPTPSCAPDAVAVTGGSAS